MSEEKILTENEAALYMDEISVSGMVLGLDSIRELLRRLGSPEKSLEFVHIAGTNGKGSILAYISTVLKTAGYKTGRFFSPHIAFPREKIQINGHPVSKKDFCRILTDVKKASDEMVAEGLSRPTVFETETALALLYFKEKECDIVVMECGLGGRDDSTNVIPAPLVTVFAHIDLDHKRILGGTIEEIADCKSAIIKEGTSVVSGIQHDEVKRVLSERSMEKEADIHFAAPEKIRYSIKKQKFDAGAHKGLAISLAGLNQPENAAAAVAALDILSEKGFEISDKALRTGLETTEWFGRFSILGKKPYVIADGAHNPDAACRLKESLEIYFPDKKSVFILGVLKDKEYDKILKILSECAISIVTVTPPENERALPSYELAKEACGYIENVTAADSIEEALETAYLLSEMNDGCPIIASGSLSWLWRFKTAYEKIAVALEA